MKKKVSFLPAIREIFMDTWHRTMVKGFHFPHFGYIRFDKFVNSSRTDSRFTDGA